MKWSTGVIFIKMLKSCLNAKLVSHEICGLMVFHINSTFMLMPSTTFLAKVSKLRTLSIFHTYVVAERLSMIHNN